jgi:hypothetical protein
LLQDKTELRWSRRYVKQRPELLSLKARCDSAK